MYMKVPSMDQFAFATTGLAALHPKTEDPGDGSDIVMAPAQAASDHRSTVRIDPGDTTAPAANMPLYGVEWGGKFAEFLRAAPKRSEFMRQLLGASIWLLWKDEGCGKIPYCADGRRRSGTLDSPEDRTRLCTFEQAMTEYIKGGYTGLAIALGPDGNGGSWQGIDLDNVEQNRLSAIANAMPGYVEFSPSGRGCHAVGYGREFSTLNPNGSGTEAYARKRFFTFTGNTIRDTGVTCLANFVEQAIGPAHSAGSKITEISSAQVDPQMVTELRSALLFLRADDYDLWVAVGMELRELGDTGRGLWLDWSATSEKFNPSEAAMKWECLRPNRTGYKAVFSKAQACGWVNPKSNAARLDFPTPAPGKGGSDLLAEMYVDWTGENDADVPDIVAGLVADEDVTLCGGHGGIGKSLLGLQMACAIATGNEVLGCQTRKSRVLYYSAEDGRKRLTRRIRNIVGKFGYDSALLRENLVVVDGSEKDPLYGEFVKDIGKAGRPYMSKVLGAKADFHNLQKMVEQYDPQLLIVDGASDTFDGNEIARRDVRAFIKLLRMVHPHRKIAVLLMVHIDRSSARGYSSNDDGYSGSSQWHNSCRRRIFLQNKKNQDGDGDVVESLLLRVMKNQDGPPMPDLELLRGDTGLWFPAVQFTGKLAHKEDRKPDEVLLKLIGKHYSAGSFMSTSLAPQASTGVHAVLKADEDFPRWLTKKRTADVVRTLEQQGKLIREPFKRANRTTAERWKVVT